jgi:hypothetical protein
MKDNTGLIFVVGDPKKTLSVSFVYELKFTIYFREPVCELLAHEMMKLKCMKAKCGKG